jgi:hypothetical protein
VIIAARVGQPVTGAAMNLVAYQGDGEVVFDSVEAVGATPGIRVLGYRVVLPTGNGIVGSAREWPPSGYELHGVAGFAYTAEGPTPQIVVGVEASRQGRSGIDGFRLRYHVGGQQYVVSYAQAVQVCVPGC